MVAIFNKILSINKTMVSSGRKDTAFNPDQESTLRDLRSALESSKAVPPGSFDLIVQTLTQWPYSERLPGLDILRCVAKYPVVAQYSDPQHGSLLDLAISASLPVGETPNENAAMMGLRTLANMFASANGRSVANKQSDKAIAFIERVIGDPIGKFNRNVLVALTTCLINYAVLVHKEGLLVLEQRRRLLVVLGAILTDQSDAEVLYRALVALGTLLSASKAEATSLDIKAWLRSAAEKSSEDRVLGVANECSRVYSK